MLSLSYNTQIAFFCYFPLGFNKVSIYRSIYLPESALPCLDCCDSKVFLNMEGDLLPLETVLALLAAGGVGLGQPVLGAGAVGRTGVRAAGLLFQQTSLIGAGDGRDQSHRGDLIFS